MGRRANLIILGSAAALIIFSLGAIVYALWPYIVSGRVKGDIAAIKAQGKPVSAADLQRRKIPDSQNAAIIYEKAAEMMSSSWSEFQTLNDFVDDEASRNSPAAWATVRGQIASHQQVLRMAAEAATRPKCQFQTQAGSHRGPGGRYSRSGPGGGGRFYSSRRTRTIVRLLAAKAIVCAKDGDTKGALEALDLVIRCGEQLSSQPMLGSVFNRLSMLRTYANTIRSITEYTNLDGQTARQIYDRLSRISLEREFVKALEADRAVAIDLFDEWHRKGTHAFDELSAQKQDDLPKSIRIPGDFAMRAVLRVDERLYLKLMEKSIRQSRFPYYVLYRKHLTTPQPGGIPKYAVFTAFLLPDFGRMWAARDSGTALLDEAKIALALEAFRSRTGSYPTSLTQLKSGLGWLVSSDPFSGNDFVYRRTASGYLLYSVGANLADDNGAKDPAPSDRWENLSSTPVDIVWKLDRRA